MVIRIPSPAIRGSTNSGTEIIDERYPSITPKTQVKALFFVSWRDSDIDGFIDETAAMDTNIGESKFKR